MTYRSLGHRAPALWLLLPLMAGLIVGKLAGGWVLAVQHQHVVMAAGLALAFVLAVVAWRFPRAWAPALVLSLMLTGMTLYTLTRARLAAWETLPPREAHLTLAVERTFPPSPDGLRVSGLARVLAADAHQPELVGQRLYFSLGLRRSESVPPRSSEIAVVGVLEALPRDPPPPSFENYLANAGLNFRLTRGRVLATTRPASAYRIYCDRMLDRLDAILAGGLEAQPALSGVLRAMMLGQKHELTEEQDTLFVQSGTMHLFAISGLHISAIAIAIYALLALIRLPRVGQFLVGTAALWLYVDVTGASPSAVRAFVMMVLLHSGRMFRVPGNPLSALIVSAVIVLATDPMQLFSASFQMSYGILAALLLLGLPLAEHWASSGQLFKDLPHLSWRWHHHARAWSWETVLGALAIGWASTLASILSGISFFQLFTPGSFFANLVLIPISMFAMFGGLGSLLTGLAGWVGGSVFCNHAAALVLAWIEWLVRMFVVVPGAFQPAAFRASWLGPAAFGALLATMAFGYAHGWERRRGGFWPPVAVVLLALVLGVKFG